MKKVLLSIAALIISVSFGWSAESSKNLVVYCPHPLEFINPIVKSFEAKTGIKVEVIAAGTGELLKRVEAEGSNPLGDILWGGSLSTVEAKKALFEPYKSVNENAVLPNFRNTDGRLTRFTVIPSVIIVNKKLIGDIKITGYEDLLNPKLKGKIAHADPAKSSSSFEHVLNQLWAMGNGDPEKGWPYIEKFIKNLDGKLLSGSSAVFKGVADGEYTVGLTFEEAAANIVRDGAPVEIVYMKEGSIVRPDGVYIIKGAKNMVNAKKFIDFVTGKEAQQLIADKLNRRSVRTDVKPGPALKPFSGFKIIKDDEKWNEANKQKILAKYKELFIK